MKKFIKYLLRLSLFAVVVFLVLRNTDFGLIQKALSQVSVTWLVPAFLFYACRYIVQGIRWHLAALAHAQSIPLQTSIRSQIEIAFLEIIFPLPDSEDGLKIAYMHRQNIPITSATAIILYDRIIGIGILLLLLPFSFLLFAKNILPVYLQATWVPVLFLLAMLPATLFHRRIIGQLFFWFEKYLPSQSTWRQALRNELEKKISAKLVILCLLLTFFYALLGTAAAWFLTRALHGEASFWFLLAGIPLYYVSAILPISIQGLGLYETALVFILKLQGIDTETAVAAGILHFVFHITVIAGGGLLYLFNTDKESLGNAFVQITRKLFRAKERA